jgi:hypothetical protein
VRSPAREVVRSAVVSTSNASQAAEIAHVVSQCLNLLFFFSAPRVFAAVRRSDGLDRDASLASLRRFLRSASDIRARAPSITGDVERLGRAAGMVEEVAGALALARFEEPLPDAVVKPARRALEALGFTEPAGGWDDFEGFDVPYPPAGPAKR